MSTELEREGLMWLARQLAWERRFEQFRQNFEAKLEAENERDEHEPQRAAA